MKDSLFNNYNLKNDEIESILKQIDGLINKNCIVDNQLCDELKQNIYYKIFITLTKNRKNIKKL